MRHVGWLLTGMGLCGVLTACEGDCSDEVIEKVTWITWQKAFVKDTLVAYTLQEEKAEYLPAYREVLQSVTLKNENAAYPNRFAVELAYDYMDTLRMAGETRYWYSDTVEIAPGATHAFWYYRQGGFTRNFNYQVHIIQLPRRVTVYLPADSLQTEKQRVNSCRENVEALKAKYRMVRELYKEKQHNYE